MYIFFLFFRFFSNYYRRNNYLEGKICSRTMIFVLTAFLELVPILYFIYLCQGARNPDGRDMAGPDLPSRLHSVQTYHRYPPRRHIHCRRQRSPRASHQTSNALSSKGINIFNNYFTAPLMIVIPTIRPGLE